MTITLREITEDNSRVVLALRCTPDQERFVTSVTDSLAEAADYPQANPWFRAVYAGEQPVGFVMLSWDVEPQPPEIIGPWFLWKLLIDRRHQGIGYGREVVRQIVELVRGQHLAAAEPLAPVTARRVHPTSRHLATISSASPIDQRGHRSMSPDDVAA